MGNLKRLDYIMFCFILITIDRATGQLEFGNKKPCDKEQHLYARTSDRELLGDLKIEPLYNKKSSVGVDKANFYDPAYGFSKEALADVLYNKEKGSFAEESILNPDVVPNLPLKTYHRHVYSKYPELGTSYNSYTPSGPSKHTDEGYQAYLKSLIDKSKYEDAQRTQALDLESYGQSRGIGYEKFLKDLFKNKDYQANYAALNAQSEDYNEALRYIWQSEKNNPAFRQYFDTNSNQGYLDLLEQTRAMNEYLKYNSADYGHNDGLDEDLPKFNERPSGRRPQGPGRLNQRPRRGPVKNCTGPRCPSRVRRPRFSPF